MLTYTFNITHNYLVEQLLAKDFPSARRRILLQYVSFLTRLGKSVSTKVRMMKSIVASDIQSTTGKNCMNMRNELNLDLLTKPASSFAQKYNLYEVPEQDTWRLPLLSSLLRERQHMSVTGEEAETISGLIHSATLEGSQLILPV